MDFSKLETPALILDEGRLTANAEKMLAHCKEKTVGSIIRLSVHIERKMGNKRDDCEFQKY